MTADFYQSREWLDLRYRVLQKSGGSCKLCGCRASPDNPIQGKSNKDDTDWRFRASQELLDKINRRTFIVAHATPAQKAKLEQLSWLRKNDADFQKEADRQYKALWQEIEADWIAKGEPR
jgi:hypothetical protein